MYIHIYIQIYLHISMCVHIHTYIERIIYYSALKSSAATWMNLKDIVLTEISQIQNEKYIILLI